jgi:hypothetical protein
VEDREPLSPSWVVMKDAVRAAAVIAEPGAWMYADVGPVTARSAT